jgi:hypothetical protein
MNTDATSPGTPERPGDCLRRPSRAKVEAQVRAAYGPKLEACERLQTFGEDALYAWTGRPIDAERAQGESALLTRRANRNRPTRK